MSEETAVLTWENNFITRKEEELPNQRIFTEFNKVFISGRIESEFEYSHKTLWETFYRTRVRVKRLSGAEDCVPLIVSNLLIEKHVMNKSLEGKWVEVVGQFRSFNKWGEDGRRHLELFLFVTLINIYDNENELEEAANANLIYLDGYVCRPPVFRITPLGREIADLFIAINRSYGKSDYIPCIVWGRLAKAVSKFEVGDRLQLYGRIQSRKYFKKNLPDGESRDAYEVSVMTVQKVQDLRLEDNLTVEENC